MDALSPELRCSICGGAGPTVESNEWWAGTFHSACTHAACAGCRQTWIEAQLTPGGPVQVTCFHRGCRKRLPQKLVLESRQARAFAAAFDRWDSTLVAAKPCGVCGELPTWRPSCDSCGASLCYECLRRAAKKLTTSNWQRKACLRCTACDVPIGRKLWELLQSEDGGVAAFAQQLRAQRAQLRALLSEEPPPEPKRALQLIGGRQLRFEGALRSAPATCCICGGAPMQRSLPACGHSVCEICWSLWAEAALERQAAPGKAASVLQVHCCAPGCSDEVPPSVWHCTSDGAVGQLMQAAQTKRSRLQLLAGGGAGRLVGQWTPQRLPPRCPQCGEVVAAVLASSACDHQGCEACWVRGCELQLPGLRAERRRAACCIAPGCHADIPAALWDHVVSMSPPLGRFYREVRSELCSLAAYSGVRLATSAPQEPGPTCVVCRDQHWALLVGSATCGHAACVPCWKRWAEEQLLQCRVAREPRLRCYAAGCNTVVDPVIWEVTRQQSTAAAQVQRELTQRAKLQQNHLYPAAMQVNCPRYGCVGLGYLGFDTVMCFICEHQWAAEDGEPPLEVDAEWFEGVAVKKCPSCGSNIEKNGGCDHMTCRCGHEFFWTTLKPYKAS